MSDSNQDKRSVILYIHSAAHDRQLASQVLEAHHYRLFQAQEGLKGIEVARACLPDLVLLDLHLPDMEVGEITTRLRTLPTTANVPIVALAPAESSQERELALAAGCSGFISTPLDLEQLPQTVEAFLQGYREPLDEGRRSQLLEQHARRVVERLERKILELEEANRQLRQLDQMKSEFIVLISHELRTPVNLVSGYSHLLAQRALASEEEDGPGSMKALARGMEEGVRRLDELVAEILSVASIAGGLLDLQYAPVRLDKVVAGILAGLAPVCRQRNLSVHLLGLEGLPAVEGDGGQLRLALGNVIGNAVKYTPDGGQLFISAEELENLVHLTVRDTGIGISPEEQQRIFDPFYSTSQLNHHFTSKHAFRGGGLGLGLAIARGVVEAHGGRLTVESEGQDAEKLPGSTFHLFLPVRPAARLS